jgi:hypothetical protein
MRVLMEKALFTERRREEWNDSLVVEKREGRR